MKIGTENKSTQNELKTIENIGDLSRLPIAIDVSGLFTALSNEVGILMTAGRVQDVTAHIAKRLEEIERGNFSIEITVVAKMKQMSL